MVRGMAFEALLLPYNLRLNTFSNEYKEHRHYRSR